MKTNLCIFMLLLLCLMSCNNEDDFNTSLASDAETELKSDHFYGTKRSKEAQTKGVAQKNNLWYNGTTIKVKFINGLESDKEIVRKYAKEWEKYANIKFQFVEDGKAEVRIGFEWNEDRYITWSYIGTDCKSVRDQNEATMSFAYWDMASERDKKGDVLRAFGQVLGLELEHRHLEFDPGWSKRISQYWEGEITDATWEDIKEYVFDPLESANVIQTKEYDENSIMIWPFSVKYATNTARGYNFDLSEADIEFIKRLYPKENVEEPIVILSTDVDRGITSVEFLLKFNSDLRIDWGDGSKIDTLRYGYDDGIHSRLGFSDSNGAVRIYGATNAITELSLVNHTHVLSARLDVSKCTELEFLEFDLSVDVDYLDVSQNSKLKYLNCKIQKVTKLDLSKNAELEIVKITSPTLEDISFSTNSNIKELKIWGGSFVNLDLSNLRQLSRLSLFGEKMNILDVSNNLELADMDVRAGLFDNVDFSNNAKLRNVSFYRSPIKRLDFSKNPMIQNIYFWECPIVEDEVALVGIAKTLPYSSVSGLCEISFGSYLAGNLYEFRNICAAKNWNIH